MRYRCIVGITLALLIPPALCAESTSKELSLAQIVAQILDGSPQASVSRLTVTSALNTYKSQFAQALPQVTFTADPVYGINKTKAPIYNQFALVTANQEQTNQQVGAGISLSQALPTAGNLSLSLHNATTVSDTIVGDTTKTVIYQAPKLSLTLSQPLFVNGKLIDMSLFPATLKSSELPYLRSLEQDALTQNNLVVQGISTYLTVVSLRKQMTQMEAMRSVQQDSLEQTRLAQTNGRATENDVMIAQISLDRQSEAILELEYSLKQSERALARLAGIEAPIDETKLSEQLPGVAIGKSPAELFPQIASKNPDVVQSRLDVENARVQAVMGGQTYSPSLSLSLSVAPQYGYIRPDSDLFGNSFTQLFDSDNGAYTDVTFSVGMQVPVYDGGRSKKDKAALNAGVKIAEENLALKLRTLRDNLDSLFLKQHYLELKVSL
ncbi:MAG TPA: TolC family protein, partial [Spirochaetia bacterium]|nr:TolC family protein [Spirochaetia bacterium]